MNESVPGNAGAQEFERQLAALRGELLRFALWLCRNRATAEDVVQESMLRAWKARSGLENPSQLKPWMLTIVRREHARLYERKVLQTVDVDELIASEDLGLAESNEREIAELRAAIMRLPDEYREPLVMQVLGGFSTQEIATELALTQAAVLTRLFRARDRLRSVYGLAPRAQSGADEAAAGRSMDGRDGEER
jgi:RNA polymerase sigma-70 factor, ECF subfamily